jgi:hypothetical protein
MEDQFDLSFDYDGTLTSQDGPIGQDNGSEVDLTPLYMAWTRGLRCAVMTCNDPRYVAEVIRSDEKHGIPAQADIRMEHKTPPFPDGLVVVVTQRKVLAKRYIDDRNITWRFGDDPELIFKGL